MPDEIMQEKARTNGHSDLTADAYGPEYTYADDLNQMTLDELYEYAGELNVNIYTPAQERKIARVREDARQRAIEANRNRWQRFILGARALFQGFAQLVILSVTLIISYLFLPVSVFGLGVAEYQRVAAGIRQFDPARASLMSSVAVATYTLLLFIQAQMLHDQPDYQRPAWSARLTARQIAYWLGIGRIGGRGATWSEQHKSTYDLLRTTIGGLAAMIVLLGTVGALQSEIVAFDGVAWHVAVSRLLTQSDLPTFLNLLGGMLLTVALLSSQHFVSMLTYDRYIQLMPEGEADFLAGYADYSAEMDRAECLYLMQMIRRAENRRASE
jgi:hypothetical protein